MAHWKYRKKSSCLVSRSWLSSLHLSKCLIKLKVWLNWPHLLTIANKWAQQLVIGVVLLLWVDSLPDPDNLWTSSDTSLAEQADGECVWMRDKQNICGFLLWHSHVIVLLFSWFSSNSGNTGITFSVLHTTIKSCTRIAAGLICNSTSVACMWYEVLKMFCLLTM